MNTLSWLLYAAHVAGGLQTLFLFSALAMFVTMIFYTLAKSCEKERFCPPSSRMIAILVAFGVLTALVPSSNTIYMIAASEMGEIVVTSPEVQEVLNALRERVLTELR